MQFVSTLRPLALLAASAATVCTVLAPSRASAEAMLLIEADSGKVLHAENATYPWYPASVTKVMTAYLTLQAVKSGRLTLDSLLTVSARAAAQAPSKIGFKPGMTVTVDNALKMLMVKSANDIAFVLAEGVGGSVEKFADEMNRTSQRLGMTQSHWVNPNGLPAEEQVSSARDLAILARAVLKDFPEYEFYWSIGAIKLGKKVMRNTNSMLGRYPGADGMKTGFICASGFNLVASATRNGRRLIAVVLGSQSSAVRGAKTAGLLERGFKSNGLAWLTPSLGTVEKLTPIDAAPPDMREEMCGKHRRRPAAEEADDDDTPVAGNGNGEPGSAQGFMLSSLAPSGVKPSTLLSAGVPAVTPIVVFAGPGKQSAESQLAARSKAPKAKDNTPKTAVANPPATKPGAKPAAAAAPAVAAVPAQTGTTAPAANPAPAAQPATSTAGFAPPAGQFTPTRRTLPAVGDGTPPYMSFAPANSNAPAPLTATPDAKPESKPEPAAKPQQPAAKPQPAKPQVAGVPTPAPRPKPKAPAEPKASTEPKR